MKYFRLMAVHPSLLLTSVNKSSRGSLKCQNFNLADQFFSYNSSTYCIVESLKTIILIISFVDLVVRKTRFERAKTNEAKQLFWCNFLKRSRSRFKIRFNLFFSWLSKVKRYLSKTKYKLKVLNCYFRDFVGPRRDFENVKVEFSDLVLM